jgi:hypothetical protein
MTEPKLPEGNIFKELQKDSDAGVNFAEWKVKVTVLSAADIPAVMT